MKLCAVDGCGKPSRVRGWCNRHYELWERNGAPEYRKPIAERFDDFWRPISGPLETPCHIWIGALTGAGYGAVKVASKTERAHRISWQRRNGSIPDGRLVMHRCDVPACVNLDHLFLGSTQDNMDDRSRKGRTHSKLNPTDIERISDVWRVGGHSQKEMASYFGLHPSTIYSVINRTSWNHI